MAETKQISTRTTLNIQVDQIEIFNEYFEDELPDTISAQVVFGSGVQDSVAFVEGDVILQMKNFPGSIDYILNADGSVTVFSNRGDVNQYSINDEGELIYEEL